MTAARLLIGAVFVLAALLLGYRVGFNRGITEGVEMSPALEEPVRQAERSRGLYDLSELQRRTATAYHSENPELARYALDLYVDLYRYWLEQETIEDAELAHQRLGLAHARLARLTTDDEAEGHLSASLEHLAEAGWRVDESRAAAFAEWLADQPFGDTSRQSASEYLAAG